MPTNPLWIEHTEKAAWDTVQALRAEIDKTRRELEQAREQLAEPLRHEAVRWFARLLDERAEEATRDRAALVAALELQLRELARARADEHHERAVAIGHLAFELARATRR